MELINETPYAAGWTLGFQPDGRELVVVAVKATFTIPSNDDEPQFAEGQIPLVEADEFTGAPGLSAPLYEADYAHRKPFCDILFNGKAYARGGRPVSETHVGLKVGQLVKTFVVKGDRTWKRSLGGITASQPKAFTSMPISYDNAFGGVDTTKVDSGDTRTYLENPVGRGYRHYMDNIDGVPLPNTEEAGNPIIEPNGKYSPKAFGVVGRNWQSRIRFAGTYDQEWLDNHVPFFPKDFDYRYFQAAPADQQISYPKGGEEVVLGNLSPEGVLRFRLPQIQTPVLFVPYRRAAQQVDAAIDTVLIEPEQRHVAVTLRAALAMRRDAFELRQLIVGRTVAHHRRQLRLRGKPHYRSIAEFIRARRQ